MKSLLAILPALLPAVYVWAEDLDKSILADGQPLNESQLAQARQVGVQHPEKIRLRQVEKLPHPQSEDFMFAAHQMGLFGTRTNGLGVGYGLCIRQECWEDCYTFVHECVHVAQFERMGGIRPFLNEYFRQCVEPGYPFGQLEQEAVHIAKDLCKNSGPLPPA